LDYIVATADSSESHQASTNHEPLAKAMGMEINDKYQENGLQTADHILQTQNTPQ
jgi:hypothetical protein